MEVFTGSLITPTVVEIPGELPPKRIPLMTFVRGNSFTKTFSLADSEGNLPDMTGGKAWWSLAPEEDGSTPLFQKTEPPGLVLDGNAAATVTLTPEETNTLIPGFYIFDLQIKDAAGAVRTIIKDVISVTDRITPQIA